MGSAAAVVFVIGAFKQHDEQPHGCGEPQVIVRRQ